MAWELLPSQPAHRALKAPALIPGPLPRLGQDRMEAAWPPDLENRNRVSAGMLFNRLARVRSNRIRQPGPVTRLGWSPAARHCYNLTYSPLRRDPWTSTGWAPLKSSSHKFGFIRSALAPGPARLLKATRPSLGSTPPSQGMPASQVHRSRTGPSCYIPAHSQLLGFYCPNRAGPGREFQVRRSGLSV